MRKSTQLENTNFHQEHKKNDALILMLDKRTNANYLTVNKALQNKKTVGVTIQGGKKEIIVIDNVAFIKKQKKNKLIISYLNNGFSKVFSLKYSN